MVGQRDDDEDEEGMSGIGRSVIEQLKVCVGGVAPYSQLDSGALQTEGSNSNDTSGEMLLAQPHITAEESGAGDAITSGGFRKTARSLSRKTLDGSEGTVRIFTSSNQPIVSKESEMRNGNMQTSKFTSSTYIKKAGQIVPTAVSEELMCDSSSVTSSTAPKRQKQFASPKVVDARSLSPLELSILARSHCILGGEPLVVSNTHLAWGTGAVNELENLFEKWGGVEVSVRNVENQRNAKVELGEYIQHVRGSISETLGTGTWYGKDLICPPQLREQISEISVLRTLGEECMFHHLPENLRAHHFMLYIGAEGSRTPGHVDLCSTVGQNLMIYADRDAHSVWHMVSTHDLPKAQQLWQAQGRSLFSDDYYCNPEELLEEADFPVYEIVQQFGDFVIVPPNAAHQVMNKGGVTLKASWNRMTIECLRECYFNTLPLYRAHLKEEVYRVSALAFSSMRNLTDSASKLLISVADNASDEISHAPSLMRMATDLSGVISIIVDMIRAQWVDLAWTPAFCPPVTEVEVKPYPDAMKSPHTRRCDFCQADIWNRGYRCQKPARGAERDDDQSVMDVEVGDEEWLDVCCSCFAQGRRTKADRVEFCEYIPTSRLRRMFEEASDMLSTLKVSVSKSYSHLSFREYDWDKMIGQLRPSTPNDATLAYMRHMDLLRSETIAACHICRTKRPCFELHKCACSKGFCELCLWRRFHIRMIDAIRDPNWECPYSTRSCNCKVCVMDSSFFPDLRFYQSAVQELPLKKRRNMLSEDGRVYFGFSDEYNLHLHHLAYYDLPATGFKYSTSDVDQSVAKRVKDGQRNIDGLNEHDSKILALVTPARSLQRRSRKRSAGHSLPSPKSRSASPTNRRRSSRRKIDSSPEQSENEDGEGEVHDLEEAEEVVEAGCSQSGRVKRTPKASGRFYVQLPRKRMKLQSAGSQKLASRSVQPESADAHMDSEEEEDEAQRKLYKRPRKTTEEGEGKNGAAYDCQSGPEVTMSGEATPISCTVTVDDSFPSTSRKIELNSWDAMAMVMRLFGLVDSGSDSEIVSVVKSEYARLTAGRE
ncbi:hypothetical protein BJ742DRAFT_831339 [Cladochytrium replicatum]|nr:hypothetical protein BJ742DRAFT_831339 [Cladochytrium replicatum]